MVDYNPSSAAPAQVFPLQDLPSTSTPVTAAWLGHVHAVLANIAGSSGRIVTLEGAGTYSDENARDAIGTALVAGANVTITVDDAGNTITIAAASDYTDEQVRDVVGAALVAGANVTIAVNDGADTITIAWAAPTAQPVDHGYLAWTDDPQRMGNSSSLSAGVMSLVEIKVPVAITATNLAVFIVNTPSTLTNSYLGLFNASGTRLGVTADQSSNWTSAGEKSPALGSPVSLAAGTYYIGMLIATATTMPNFSRGASSNATNAGRSTPYRSATSGSSLTAIPSSVTYSGTTASGVGWWAAIK